MKRTSLNKQQEGFVLPLIIIIGLIVGAGLMALMARSFGFLFGTIRHGQNQQAREAAESGMAVILKELNTNYPYLLINDCTIEDSGGAVFCSGWADTAAGGTFEYITSVCPSTTTPPETIFSKMSANLPGGTSSYKLISYNFTGDQHQGGTATIRLEGKSLYSNNNCLLYTSPSPRDQRGSRMPSSA